MSAPFIDLRGIAIQDMPRSKRDLAERAGFKWPLSADDEIKFSQVKILIMPLELEKMKGGAA